MTVPASVVGGSVSANDSAVKFQYVGRQYDRLRARRGGDARAGGCVLIGTRSQSRCIVTGEVPDAHERRTRCVQGLGVQSTAGRYDYMYSVAIGRFVRTGTYRSEYTPAPDLSDTHCSVRGAPKDIANTAFCLVFPLHSCRRQCLFLVLNVLYHTTTPLWNRLPVQRPALDPRRLVGRLAGPI